MNQRSPKAEKDARAVYMQAKAYLRAGAILFLRINPKDGTELLGPCVVLHAFACELFLKCLLKLTVGGDPPRKHSINALYGLLPARDREAIAASFEEFLALNPHHKAFLAMFPGAKAINFASTLDDLDHAFENWRYMYEQAEHRSTGGLDSMLKALGSRVTAHRPDWPHFAPQLP